MKFIPPILKTQLATDYERLAKTHLGELFLADQNRFQRFSLEAAGIFCDFSKNLIDEMSLQHLLDLAKMSHLSQHIQALFQAEKINLSEDRAANYPSLRQPQSTDNPIKNTLQRMADLSQQIENQAWRGFDGQTITDVVNIGIGGSDLGPRLVYSALQAKYAKKIRCHFVANIDSDEIQQTLKTLHPATTLFIISSKSFKTPETLANAMIAKNWLARVASDKPITRQHLLAVTANVQAATAFGIESENIFPIWDFVGGRFSLWSAIGLVNAIGLGMDAFAELLAGAHAMDQHFQNSPLEKNLPVILALLSIWYRNFFQAETQAILTYAHALRLLPNHLQQLTMESLGKCVDFQGKPIDYATSQIIWGGEETNGQHAFHQFLLQSNSLVPMDFILNAAQPELVANALAQSRALMLGFDGGDQPKFKNYRAIPGNQPSNTLILPQINPRALGALLALYEHKTFAQSVIWQINGFDQWGVEYGKILAEDILKNFASGPLDPYDDSTRGLINFLRKNWNIPITNEF